MLNQITWKQLKEEKREKAIKTFNEAAANILLIGLVALFFYSCFSGLFSPDCIIK